MNARHFTVGTLAFALGHSMASGVCSSPETELRSAFEARVPVLSKLAAMSNQDSAVVRVAPQFTWLEDSLAWPRPPERLGFSQRRWDEYRRLFGEVGATDGLVRSGRQVRFLVKACGISVSGKSFGYAFLPEAPASTVHSLEAAEVSGISFMPLRGSWYLFVQR
jgi:hypothetical protein